ncbi:MAG TPA: DUF309 domain-containing protein [Thermoanaerobaculia bacterium]|nr:DUF309 domain-containing protein [Thermoanaerobaculia bacterium]
MPIHPVLRPGLEAYRRGDYVQALVAWEEPWKALTGDDRELALALVRLAGALHHQQNGRSDSSDHLYASSREVLDRLPPAVLGVDVARLRRTLPDNVEQALVHPIPLPAAPLVPRPLLLRFLTLVALVVTGFVVLRWTPLAESMTVEKISALFDRLRETWWAPLALLACYVVLCPLGVPATPMMITGGVVFGTVQGSIYNLLGTFLGGASTYFLGRLLGRDFVLHIAGKKLKRVERAIARRGFWGMVGVRFLPLPYPLVNYCAALAGIRPALFLTTTAIGLAPTVTLFTYFASTLSRLGNADRSGLYLQLAAASLGLLLLTLVPQVMAGRKRRVRYRTIRETRRARGI